MNKLRDELCRRYRQRAPREDAFRSPPPEDNIDALLERRLRGTDPDWKDLRRAAEALYRRGYSWEDVDAGIRRYQENRNRT
jgi:regulatory protein